MAPFDYNGHDNNGVDTAVSGIPEVWLLWSNHSNQMNLSKAMQWRQSVEKIVLTV